MTKAVQKITLSRHSVQQAGAEPIQRPSCEGGHFDRASIAARTLLQRLNVRAVVDGEGNEAGMFEVPAGGRRCRALELLVKQKRMAKTQAVPYAVR